MTKIELKLNSSNDLKMSVKSHGDINSITEVALIIESDKFDYKFNGHIVNGIVNIKIPRMQGIIESGEYKAKLNMVADGDKFFTPLQADVSFKEADTIAVSETEIKQHTVSEVEVGLITTDIVECIPEPLKVQEAPQIRDLSPKGVLTNWRKNKKPF